MLMQMAEEVNYMQQLTIFDVLDEMENESLRAEWEQDIYTLIQLRLEEMGLENYFDLSNTKIHLRTDAADKRLFVSLLSNVALLHDVQIEENEVYTYVIEADLTATQLGELQDLFLEDADNNAIEIRLNEKGKWEACY